MRWWRLREAQAFVFGRGMSKFAGYLGGSALPSQATHTSGCCSGGCIRACAQASGGTPASKGSTCSFDTSPGGAAGRSWRAESQASASARTQRTEEEEDDAASHTSEASVSLSHLGSDRASANKAKFDKMKAQRNAFKDQLTLAAQELHKLRCLSADSTRSSGNRGGRNRPAWFSHPMRRRVQCRGEEWMGATLVQLQDLYTAKPASCCFA